MPGTLAHAVVGPINCLGRSERVRGNRLLRFVAPSATGIVRDITDNAVLLPYDEVDVGDTGLFVGGPIKPLTTGTYPVTPCVRRCAAHGKHRFC